MLHVVCDLQWGSSGKGLYCAYLGQQLNPEIVAAGWGPNSGHTAYLGDTKLVTKVIPMSAFFANQSAVLTVLIGPGSVFGLSTLVNELQLLWATKRKHCPKQRVTVIIHPHACVLSNKHRVDEQQNGGLTSIGSTQSGNASAAAAKVRRDSLFSPLLKDNNRALVTLATCGRNSQHTPRADVTHDNTNYRVLLPSINNWTPRTIARGHNSVLCEGSQGIGLGINTGPWPHVTSRDCTAASVLDYCGIPMQNDFKVHGVARLLPIRVANRYLPVDVEYQQRSAQIGSSGPHFNDQDELDWGIDLPDVAIEQTTVTKRERRIFTFSRVQFEQGLEQIRPHSVFLNFVNYPFKSLCFNNLQEVLDTYPVIDLTGHGAMTSDVQSTNKKE